MASKKVRVELSCSYEGGGIYVLHFDGKPMLSIDTNEEMQDSRGKYEIFDADGDALPGTLAEYLLNLPDAPEVGTDHREEDKVNHREKPWRLYHK